MLKPNKNRVQKKGGFYWLTLLISMVGFMVGFVGFVGYYNFGG